jgi:hypothetical protein
MPGYFDKFIEKVKPTSIDYTDACNFGNLPADQKYGGIVHFKNRK